MAVEIPVIVDIESAFNDAASRVNTAIEPLQRKLSNEALNVQVGVRADDAGNKIPVLLRDIKDSGVNSMSVLSTAIDNVSRQLIKAAEASDKIKFTTLLEAKSYLDDMASGYSRARTEIDGLANSMQGLSSRLQAARQAMETTPIHSGEFKDVVKDYQAIVAEQDRLNQKIAEMGMKSGSIDKLSAKLSDLQKQWSALGSTQMFKSDGSLSTKAEKLQQEYAKISAEVERRNALLTETIKKQQELERTVAAEKKHQEELSMMARSMDDLNTKLRAWTQELNASDIDSSKWDTAAMKVAELSKQIRLVQESLRDYMLQTGSIDTVSEKLQRVNAQWNEMGARRKFVNGVSGELTAEAKAMVDKYKMLTSELNTNSLTLSKILQKEQQMASLIEKNARKRKYENAILNATSKSMMVLTEKERILSDRLNRAEIGSSKYNQLKNQLTAVRNEIDMINGKNIRGSIAEVNDELEKSNSRLGVLVKNALRLAALHSATSFIRNVREVTAEFELQRVALGGIIQDTQKADSLFRQIKAAAIKSPFEIKDLVSFTKQLSAYRIETENLFDVTMRLADVSAGLGVDMSRLVLAYGQVRAASVLRGQELRQFTEAGIPLVDLLAKKFGELRNETVSTAEVFDLISRRAVPFKMIEEIFNDMTSAGGTFYKMQEKQAETLKGQWMNLKDSVSIMYDEIGNTSTVNNAMTSMINFAKTIFSNWRSVSGILKAVGLQFVSFKLYSLFVNNLVKSTKLARQAAVAHSQAEALRARAVETGKRSFDRAARSMLIYEMYMRKAADAGNLFMRGYYQLMATLRGGKGLWGIALTAVTALAGALFAAGKEARQLEKDLAENTAKAETNVVSLQRNFARLSEKILKAGSGTAEQREALKELQRTYGDILPSEDLQIEKLRTMKGEYDQINQSIRDYIFLQTYQQNVETIESSFSSRIGKAQNKLQKAIINTTNFTRDEAIRIIDDIAKYSEAGGLVDRSSLNDIVRNATGVDLLSRAMGGYSTQIDLFLPQAEKLSRLYLKMDKALVQNDEDLRSHSNNVGIYTKDLQELKKEMEQAPVTTFKEGSYEFNEAKLRQNIYKIGNFITKELAKSDVKSAFSKSYVDATAATIDFDSLYEDIKGALHYEDLKKTIDEIKKMWIKMAPQESETRLIRAKMEEFAEAVHLPMSKFQGNLKQDGQSLVDYTKQINEALEDAKNKLNSMNLQVQEAASSGHWVYKVPTEQELSDQNAYIMGLQMMADLLSGLAKTVTRSGGSQPKDPFITLIEERIKFMQDYKKGYDDFSKYLSKEDSLQKIGNIMLGRGMSLGLSRDEQQEAAENLSQWYSRTMEQVMDKMRDAGIKGVSVSDFLALDINTKNRAQKDLQKVLQSLWDAKTDYDVKEMANNFKNALKKVEEEVKRSETARNFFKDILGITGDEMFSASLSVAVYGGFGHDFKKKMQEQLDIALTGLNMEKLEDGLEEKIRKAFKEQDFDVIRQNLSHFSEETRAVLKQILNDVDRYNAGLEKKFADLASKSGDIAQQEATIKAKAEMDIRDINEAADRAIQQTIKKANEQIEKSQNNAERRAIENYRDIEIARINEYRNRAISNVKAGAEYEIFQNSEDFVKYFSELNVMTVDTANNLRLKLRNAYIEAARAGKISARELYKGLQMVDAQYEKLQESQSLLNGYLKEGADGLFNRMKDMGNIMSSLSAKFKEGMKFDPDEEKFLDRMTRIWGKKFGGEEFKGASSVSDVIQNFKNNGKSIGDAGAAFAQMGSGISAAASKASMVVAIIDMIFKAINGAITGIQEFIDELNRTRSEEYKVADGMKYMSDINKYIYEGWEKVKAGDVLGATMNLGSAVASVFSNIREDKVIKMNKLIEKQDDLLKSLTHSYNRLQAAEEKVFGADIVTNYNQRLDALRAEVEAYRKMAELERQKGKATDEKKARDYETQAIEVAESISDMQDELQRKFAGTDLASSSRDFATSWIEAYKSFSSTTGAIKEKFQDMIKNMITESLAAKVVERQLKPIFDLIDDLSREGGELSMVDISIIANKARATSDILNSDLTNLMNALGSVGLNVRTMGSGLTGIAKDIQGASEESILGLAAGVNTQNFYLQQINANVGVLVSAVSGASSVAPSPTIGAIAETDPMREHISSINTNVMLIADRVSSLESTLKKVVYPNGVNSTTHYVAIQ